MIKLGLTVGVLAVCNAVLAALTPWYIVTRLGIGIESDSFFASGALPQLVFWVVSFSLLPVLVPVLATGEESTFRRDAWGFFVGVSAFFTLLCLLLFITANQWVPLMVPGFSDQAKGLTVRLSRIQLFAVVGNASVVVLWSVYYARQKFIWVELSSVLANTAALLFLLWALSSYGVAAAAWAAVLNLGLKMALLLPALGRWQRPQWDSYAIKESWRRIKPFLFGQTYSRTEPLIDRFLTSMLVAGNLSLLYIGQQIYSAVNLIISKAISAPSVPSLAVAAKAGDWFGFMRSYRQRLLWMAGLATSIGLVILIAGEFLLRLLIGHGGITSQNVHTLWWVMLALIGMLVGGSTGQVTSSAFYATGDTKTPTLLFIWSYSVYIPIKVLIFFRFGLIGLAVATSVHLVANFLLQLLVLERRARSLTLRGVTRVINNEGAEASRIF